eukprot:COSAG01_NODE_9527_length_2418_cov_31.584304_3_plen_134_part_00
MSHFLAWVGSPCLRRCVHGASITATMDLLGRLLSEPAFDVLRTKEQLGYVVSRAFPSWSRSISTEIYLCHACSDHEILRVDTPGQVSAGVRRTCGIFGICFVVLSAKKSPAEVTERIESFLVTWRGTAAHTPP